MVQKWSKYGPNPEIRVFHVFPTLVGGKSFRQIGGKNTKRRVKHVFWGSTPKWVFLGPLKWTILGVISRYNVVITCITWGRRKGLATYHVIRDHIVIPEIPEIGSISGYPRNT